MLFSKEVIALYHKIKDESDPSERAELMIEMAELFVEETDDTDPHLGEDVHDIVTEVIQSRIVADRKSMSLARVIMRSIPSYLSDHADLTDDDDTSNVN